MSYKKVFVCSPYRGKTGKNKEIYQNMWETMEYCRKLVEKYPDFIPIAPHIYFPQFMDEDTKRERELGMAMGRAVLANCDYMLVFGGYVSEGMRAELMEAKRLGIPVYNGDAALMGDGLVRMTRGFWEKHVGTMPPEDCELGFHVKFPCSIGDTLWVVTENKDTRDIDVMQSPPVRALAISKSGKFAAETYGDGKFDEIGGPLLYLTEEDARAEQARRQVKRKKTTE